jgi:alkyl sulfatase BDS1-like metallo-beta-lactamase superfamily hydrolase
MSHAKGETDDHLWTWVPDHRALCVGDLVTWVFPNCGNPQKVQRYPLEWAQALRKMMTYEAEWLLPAHGLVVRGADRVATVLGDLASALELLTEETLAMMNAGESLDAIIHQVTVPDDLLVKPWMQPVYDEPEFVVRNLWRLYGGWWDKNPAHLKPVPESVFAAEMAALAGGADALTARATELAAAGDLRLACQVVELAVQADPESTTAHGARAEIYQQRRNEEFSLMSKGIFAAAARESRAIADQ